MNENYPTKIKSFIKNIQLGIIKEKLYSLVKYYQKHLSYVAATIAVLLVCWGAFSWYDLVQSKKYSVILHQSMIDEQSGEIEKSVEALKKIYQSGAPAGVKEIASLKYALSLIKNGKNDEALEVYLKTNQNTKFDQYIREYSGLVALKMMVDENKSENKEKILALEAKLEKKSKTLKYHIIEQKGLFLWHSGDFKAANEIFSSLASNPESSEFLKKRSQEMVAIYKSKFGSQDSAKLSDKNNTSATQNNEKELEEPKKEAAEDQSKANNKKGSK